MKWIQVFGMWVGMLCVTGMAQEEVPPAFERGDDEKEAGGTDLFDPSLYAPKSVRIRVEFIDMPHKTATRLLMEDKSKTMDATGLRMKVQALADKDEAKVLDTQVVLARSNLTATVESNHELMYPEEYNLPALDVDTQKKLDSLKVPDNPAIPGSFTTRNLGGTLEVSPVIDENSNLVHLRLVPELVWHAGDRVWYEGKDSAGNPFQVKMPGIYSIRVKTDITCVDGQYCMLCVLSPKDEKGMLDHERKVMVFVKCDVLSSIP